MFLLPIHFIAKKSKNKQKRAYEVRNVIYTDEYYTHEYIKEITRFRAEEKLVIYDSRGIKKTGLINEFI